jgi:DsbC/DsbD-like thiol-disulfide interchange protein
MRMRDRHVVAAVATAWALAGVALPAGRAGPPRRSADVVNVTAGADAPGADGRQVITVTLAVAKGWHVYANPVGNEELGPPTTVAVEGKDAADVRVEYPVGELNRDGVVGDYFTYEGTVRVRVNVRRTAGDSPLTIKVRFRADRPGGPCFGPSTVMLSVP